MAAKRAMARTEVVQQAGSGYRAHDVLISSFLVFLALVLLGWLLHLNGILWEPTLPSWGRKVDDRRVHELGVNIWFHGDEAQPFSGVGTFVGSSGRVEKERFFRDGMLHHMTFYNPESGSTAFEVHYLNGKESRVRIWDSNGTWVGEFLEPEKWLPELKKLGYSQRLSQ